MGGIIITLLASIGAVVVTLGLFIGLILLSGKFFNFLDARIKFRVR